MVAVGGNGEACGRERQSLWEGSAKPVAIMSMKVRRDCFKFVLHLIIAARRASHMVQHTLR